jgi:hypothetical protein
MYRVWRSISGGWQARNYLKVEIIKLNCNERWWRQMNPLARCTQLTAINLLSAASYPIPTRSPSSGSVIEF